MNVAPGQHRDRAPQVQPRRAMPPAVREERLVAAAPGQGDGCPARFPPGQPQALRKTGMLLNNQQVLTAAQMEKVKQVGGRFAVSPGATPRLYAAARDTDLPFLPGVATSSELMHGLEQGLDTFKFFPAVQAGGAAMLSAWNGPFGDVRFCPTGGISAQTARDFLHLPNVLCVGGSWLTTRALLQARDWAAIEQLARDSAALVG